jgi:membrane protein DedA with SNARE-associated domain
VLTSLWQRFLWLGLTAKAVVVVVVLYALGWIAGQAGLDGVAHSLALAAIFVAGLLLTVLFMRVVWRLSRKPGQ